jgi:LAO/AO transport system kinase
MLLVEAAGFDVVLIETVGVGQSETAVADMVDMFVLLQSPGGGDDLQGIKRGIMELADLIVVNKADGALEQPAKLARSQLISALHLMRPRSPNWKPHVLLTSALTNMGIGEVWDAVTNFETIMLDTGERDPRGPDRGVQGRACHRRQGPQVRGRRGRRPHHARRRRRRVAEALPARIRLRI